MIIGPLREATIIDKAINLHYVVLTDVYGRQHSFRFDNEDRDAVKSLIQELNCRGLTHTEVEGY